MTDQSQANGYKGHQAGSRKGRVHQAFDEQDADVALALGQQLGLKPSTLKTWFATWARDAKAEQAKAAAKAKAGKKTGQPRGAKVAKVEANGRQSVEAEKAA